MLLISYMGPVGRGPQRAGGIRSKTRSCLLNRAPSKTGNSFKIWCGEGDLNPHEIAPASTSSDKTLYRRVSWWPKLLILGERLYRRVSQRILKPLQFRYSRRPFLTGTKEV